MRGEREDVYMEAVECACMGTGRVCIWKGWSVHAWGEGGCVYGRGGVCVHGEREGVCTWKGRVCIPGQREGVYMEGVECACIGRGGCVCGRGGLCMHGEREGVCT